MKNIAFPYVNFVSSICFVHYVLHFKPFGASLKGLT